jgi:hypothetical protein
MKYIILFIFATTILFAQGSSESVINPSTECTILEDENSIICKFEFIRDNVNEQEIVINWVNPNGEVSRTRNMIIPVGDSSAYDFRYINGRESGKWDFKVTYKNQEYTTSFELK